MYFTICITFLTLKSPKFIFYKYTDISKLISSMYHIPVFLIVLGVVLAVLLGDFHVQGAPEAVQEVALFEITRVVTHVVQLVQDVTHVTVIVKGVQLMSRKLVNIIVSTGIKHSILFLLKMKNCMPFSVRKRRCTCRCQKRTNKNPTPWIKTPIIL